MSTLGVANPQRSWPLLSTRELFLLKWGKHRPNLATYQASSIKTRRAVVASLATASMAELRFSDDPIGVDQAEWFASASDLARVLDWLRTHTATPATEPGVLSMAFLLQSTNGNWYTLTGVWNNPRSTLDEVQFSGLMIRASELLAETR